MDRVQIIKNAKGEAAFAVVPWNEYERLKAASGEDAALARLGEAARSDERFPGDIAKRLIAGEVPLRVFREWRGFSQADLAGKARLAKNYVSQIERGERNVGRKAAGMLAPILRVSVEALMDL